MTETNLSLSMQSEEKRAHTHAPKHTHTHTHKLSAIKCQFDKVIYNLLSKFYKGKLTRSNFSILS